MATFSWELAEALAVAHMREIGFDDAKRTPQGADRGLDGVSERAASQVKARQDPVGAPEIQQLKGAAENYEFVLFYSFSGYTAQAVEFANVSNVALFTFDRKNNVVAFNERARWLSGSESPKIEAIQAARDVDSVTDLVRGVNVLLSELTNWLTLSPWVYLVPLDRVEAVESRIGVSALGIAGIQLKAATASIGQSAGEVNQLAEELRVEIEKSLQNMAQAIEVDFSGSTPDEAVEILRDSLRQHTDRVQIQELKDSVKKNFSDPASAWTYYLPIVSVIVRTKKFLKAMNSEVGEIEKKFSIDVDSDERCTDSRKKLKAIIQEFSDWANETLENGEGNGPAGEKLLLAGVEEYHRLAVQFGRSGYETIAFSDAKPAGWLSADEDEED